MLSELAFYVDADTDESYTPRTVSIRSGSLHHDLEELRNSVAYVAKAKKAKAAPGGGAGGEAAAADAMKE